MRGEQELNDMTLRGRRPWLLPCPVERGLCAHISLSGCRYLGKVCLCVWLSEYLPRETGLLMCILNGF